MEVARGGGGVGGLGSSHQIIRNCTVEIRVLSILNIHFKTRQVFLYKKENQLGMKIRFVHYDCLRL